MMYIIGMKAMTSTELRNDIFAVLDRALNGRPALVRTRRGDVVLKRARRATVCPGAARPKIAGRIAGDMTDADAALREYLRWRCP